MRLLQVRPICRIGAKSLPGLLLLLSLAVAEPTGAELVPLTEKPMGTGVIVHPEGYVLTAHHVVAGARRIVVVTAGEVRNPAIIISLDAEHDLVLLKIDTVGLSEAPIGYAGAVRLDQEVLAAGFPFGLRDIAIVHGRISAVRTKGVKRVFQVDAAMNPGNSGGPVFNTDGQLIGIVTTKFSHPSGIVPEGMTFAVPISYATPLLANIPEFDFAAIGRHAAIPPRDRSADSARVDLVGDLVRTTVRIEVSRSVEPAAATSKPDPTIPRAEGRSVPRARPEPFQEPSAVEDRESLVKTNEQLLAHQQEELQRLAERGLRSPEGMVLIPAGEFLRGADDGFPDARPLHRTYISSFWIDRYEVTNAQYRRCVEARACQPPRDPESFDDGRRANHPVVNVTWNHARAYCEWLGRRLPSEAEWEKAARGTDARRYPWGNGEQLIARVRTEQSMQDGARGQAIGPVGSHPETASPYGIHDAAGNVWEWVKDWYAEDAYSAGPSRDPQGPLRGSFRVLRGGDWSQSPLELRTSYRGWDEMSYWGPLLGFRCADDAP